MTDPRWAADPTGRFTQRWFNGRDWTDDVIGANGQPAIDPMARTSTGIAAPAAAGPTSPSTPAPTRPPGEMSPPNAPAPSPVPPSRDPVASAPPPTWGSPPPGPAPVADALAQKPERRLGSIISGIGLVLVLLSLFVLNWVDGDPSSFSGFGTAFGKADLSGAPVLDQFSQVYVRVLAYLLLGAVGVGVAVVAVRLRSASATVHGVVAAMAGVAAVAHAVVVERLFRGPFDPYVGAWLAVGGYLVVIAGMAVTPVRATPSRAD